MPTQLHPEALPATETLDNRGKILIIEDDFATAEILSVSLRRQGFEPITAHCAAQGWSDARREQPQLILLDLMLPDGDGLELCQRLVDSPETCLIPVIVVSASDAPDVVRRARSMGCHFFVHKPYDPNALLVLIQTALGSI